MSDADASGAIDRLIPVDAPPVTVAAALDELPWSDAVRVEPAGSGCRMVVTARISPRGLVAEVERLLVDELCRLRRRAERAGGAMGGGPYRPVSGHAAEQDDHDGADQGQEQPHTHGHGGGDGQGGP